MKKRRDESDRTESPPSRQNGSEEKRKSSSDRKRFLKLIKSHAYIFVQVSVGDIGSISRLCHREKRRHEK